MTEFIEPESAIHHSVYWQGASLSQPKAYTAACLRDLGYPYEGKPGQDYVAAWRESGTAGEGWRLSVRLKDGSVARYRRKERHDG